MAKVYPIQHSFSAGELSPQLVARTDLEGYSKSARRMRNMVPSIQGPARSRPGFRFVAEAVEASEQYCRMVPFHVSFVESYAIIITILWVYIADLAGFSPSENLFTNARFNDAGDDWTTNQPGAATVIFSQGLCTMVSAGDPNLASIRQQITTDVAEIAEEHLVGYRGLSTSPVRVKVGTTEGGTEILDTTLAGADGVVAFVPGVVTFWVEFESPENTSKVLDTTFCYNPADGVALTRFPSPYPIADRVEEIQFEMVPGGRLMYLFQRDTPPHYVDYLGEHVWDFGEITFEPGEEGDEPPPWQPGAEDSDIHPGAVTFWKGRMYVGGTDIDEVGIWASTPGEFLQFVLPTGDPEDSDPMYLPLDTEGDIMWLLGGKALFVGTDTGEHIIFGEGNAIPTPANVDTEQQSAYGSARVQAVKIGEQVAFTTPDRRKLYLTSYNRDSLGWVGHEVSYPSGHITEGLLREIELSTTPSQILWFPTFTGELVGMIFDARREIVGWHRHSTQGFIVSTTIVRNRGQSELWAGILRGADLENQTLHFERFAPEQMDSYLTVTELVPTDTFNGFDHLEGRTVQVLTDRAVHRDLVVGESGTPGQIVIDYDALEVVAGLSFLPILETLPIEMIIQGQSVGSFAKSWSKIFIKVLNSTRPKINGIRPPVRNEETPMNLPEPSQTEDVGVANLGWDYVVANLGWDLDATITVEQDLPLVLEVAGVFGELDLQNIDD